MSLKNLFILEVIERMSPKSADILIASRKVQNFTFGPQSMILASSSGLYLVRTQMQSMRWPFKKTLSQLLQNSCPSFGPLATMLEPLKPSITFIVQTLLREACWIKLHCVLFKLLNVLKTLSITSLTIHLTTKRSQMPLNSTIFLTFLPPLAVSFCKSVMIQQILISIPLEEGIVLITTTCLFLLSK